MTTKEKGEMLSRIFTKIHGVVVYSLHWTYDPLRSFWNSGYMLGEREIVVTDKQVYENMETQDKEINL